MTGADRFQLILDENGRKKSGIGNVLRTHIITKGHLPENEIKERFLKNEGIKFLLNTSLSKKWNSPITKWKNKEILNASELISFYHSDDINILLNDFLKRDCNIKTGTALSLDIVYESNQKTHFIFSVNHTLIDYAGFEMLLRSFSSGQNEYELNEKINKRYSFSRNIINTIKATAFVAARSGWNIQCLKKTMAKPVLAFHSIEISKTKLKNTNRKVNGIPLYLASTIFAWSRQKNYQEMKDLPLFIPTPVERRFGKSKNALRSNYLSFLFFRIDKIDITDIQNLSEKILKQLILQAKLNIPDKFQSLLDVFAYLPDSIYKAFINLPSKGKSSTFAFSSLPISFLQSGDFCGQSVENYTYYPPFLSPPGINIVFMEMKEGLKIITSFDVNRISKEEVTLLLAEIKNSLAEN